MPKKRKTLVRLPSPTGEGAPTFGADEVHTRSRIRNSPEYKVMMTQRDREVRDIYNQHMKTYRAHVVYSFFKREYNLMKGGVDHIIKRVDDQDVDPTLCRSVYIIAMTPGYQLI